MKRCAGCYAPNPDTKTNCYACGALLPATATPNTTPAAAGNLHPCPDCGRQVSIHARACPGCGRPFGKPEAISVENSYKAEMRTGAARWVGEGNLKFLILVVIGVITFFGSALFFWIAGKMGYGK